jgi:type VI secretion system protein ImpK
VTSGERIRRMAQVLTEDYGLVPGNRVLLRGGNSVNMALAWLGVVHAGLVAVKDEADRSVVILKGDGLFASASTVVRDRYEPVINRIAQAMNNVSGKILVVGYSDNVPIRSARFASNYELSLERARSVQKQLQGSLSQPERVKAEGRGEINPVAPNNTPENRARNRRVEITLLVSPENTQAELNGLPQGN